MLLLESAVEKKKLSYAVFNEPASLDNCSQHGWETWAERPYKQSRCKDVPRHFDHFAFDLDLPINIENGSC